MTEVPKAELQEQFHRLTARHDAQVAARDRAEEKLDLCQRKLEESRLAHARELQEMHGRLTLAVAILRSICDALVHL